MRTTDQNDASERLRSAIKNAIFTLADNRPDKSIELKAALDNFWRCHMEREANEFLMEEVLEALDRASKL